MNRKIKEPEFPPVTIKIFPVWFETIKLSQSFIAKYLKAEKEIPIRTTRDERSFNAIFNNHHKFPKRMNLDSVCCGRDV